MLIANITEFLQSLPELPGVYRMFNSEHKILYVGKAKNLKRRVSSYFQKKHSDEKTTALIAQIASIEITITETENEALLLENTLIKTLRPKYNILFKDDKSYPFLFISDHFFPRLTIHRGPRKKAGKYFGPYTSGLAARESLAILQKIFRLRKCSDSFFSNRSRPCVQYQIGRCTAPCVGYISEHDYGADVARVIEFLQGKSSNIIKLMQKEMQQAALELKFEQAAQLRNQIESLKQIALQQHVTAKKGNADVAVALDNNNVTIIYLLFIRGGQVVGNKSFFISVKGDNAALLATFLTQYYLSPENEKNIPSKIIVNHKLTDNAWIERAFSAKMQRKVVIQQKVKGTQNHWLKMALLNAEHALAIREVKKNNYLGSIQELKKILHLKSTPKSFACFDISHSMGDYTVASCVVFDENGTQKGEYRRFNIKNVAKSDDYAAIEQAVSRRYQNKPVPDIVIIDGGKGQLHAAQKILHDKDCVILAIAKGPSRKPGKEIILATTLDHELSLPEDSAALHFLQNIRDEAHRFAIQGHRLKLRKAKIVSVLENIPGIGAKKRQLLLKHFGGLQAIKSATLEQLMQIPGINRQLAEKIQQAMTNLEPS